MNYSLRKLYAMGEPLGECVTTRKPNGGYCCGGGGGGGSSTSSSATTTTTNNTDSRVVGGNDSINASVHNSTVSLTTTDRGAVAGAFGFAKEVSAQAFNFASASQVDTSKTVKD